MNRNFLEASRGLTEACLGHHSPIGWLWTLREWLQPYPGWLLPHRGLLSHPRGDICMHKCMHRCTDIWIYFFLLICWSLWVPLCPLLRKVYCFPTELTLLLMSFVASWLKQSCPLCFSSKSVYAMIISLFGDPWGNFYLKTVHQNHWNLFSSLAIDTIDLL